MAIICLTVKVEPTHPETVLINMDKFGIHSKTLRKKSLVAIRQRMEERKLRCDLLISPAS
jgi:hypothetical protein